MQHFLHYVVCLATSPWALPKRVLQQCDLVLPLKCQYFPFSLTSSYGCLSFPTFILRYIFPSTALLRKQFIHKICPIQLVFLGLFVCRTSLSFLVICNTFLFFTQWVHKIFNILLQLLFSKLPCISDLFFEVSKF